MYCTTPSLLSLPHLFPPPHLPHPSILKKVKLFHPKSSSKVPIQNRTISPINQNITISVHQRAPKAGGCSTDHPHRCILQKNSSAIQTQKTPPNSISKTKVSHSYKFLAPTLKSTNIPMHAILLPRDTEKGHHVEAWVRGRRKNKKMPVLGP